MIEHDQVRCGDPVIPTIVCDELQAGYLTDAVEASWSVGCRFIDRPRPGRRKDFRRACIDHPHAGTAFPRIVKQHVKREHVDSHHFPPDSFITEPGRSMNGSDVKSHVGRDDLQELGEGLGILEVEADIAESVSSGDMPTCRLSSDANYGVLPSNQSLCQIAAILPVDTQD